MSGYEEPKSGGENSLWTSSTPLSNQDFRKLLATPRPGQQAPVLGFKKPQGSRPKPTADFDDDGAFKKPLKPKSKKPQKPKDDGDDKDDGPKYRDRAEERRKGVNPDYEKIDVDFSSVLQARGVGVAIEGVNPQVLSVEESKFLGGDVEHTHLVKGLDFALLQKERIKMEKQQEEAAQRAATKSTRMRREEMRFVSATGRGVFESLFNPPRNDVREMFLPRRTAFVFEFDSAEGGDTDIPTTLRRSKADCPPPQECRFAGTDGAVLERISKILSYIKVTASGKSGKKVKRQEKEAYIKSILAGGDHKVEQYVVKGAVGQGAGAEQQGSAGTAGAGKAAGAGATAAAASTVVVDDDEDIFGDAGDDYKPTVKRKEPAAGAAAAAAAGGSKYFDKKDDMSDIPMPGQHKAPAGALPPPPAAGGAAGQDADMDIEDGEMGAQLPGPPADAAAAAAAAAQYYQGGYDPAQYQQYGQYDASGQYYGEYAQGQYPQGYDYQAYALQQQQQYQQQQGYQQQPEQAKELTQQDKDKGLATVFKQDGERWRVKRDDEGLKGFADEAYGECFPEYAAAGDVVGSDDEDVAVMDDGTKGKSRYDFATEEEWQSYKATQGAMPKAAFQFGVKVADGRKGVKEMKKTDTKLDSQLGKIEKLLQEKGHDHAGAFRRERRGEADLSLPVPKKRQRI